MAYRRRIFLINRKFQFRFSFYVSSWLIALSFVYPLIIFQLFDFFLKYLAADPNAPDIASLLATRQNLFSLLVLMQIVLVGVTFLLSIFLSHRIAGPLFKLKRFFAEAATGKLTGPLHFRKTDHFHDVAEDYNKMMDGLRQRGVAASAELAEAQQLLQKIPGNPAVDQIAARLKQAQSWILK